MKLFDLLIKGRIQKHSSPVDTDQLWKDIQKKKHKRRFIIFWWPGLGLILTIGVLYFFMNTSNETFNTYKLQQLKQSAIAKENSDSNSLTSKPNNPDKDLVFQSKETNRNLKIDQKNTKAEQQLTFQNNSSKNKVKSIPLKIVTSDFYKPVESNKTENSDFIQNSLQAYQSSDSSQSAPEILVENKPIASEKIIILKALPVLLKHLKLNIKSITDLLKPIPNPVVKLRVQVIEKPWYLQISIGQALVNRSNSVYSDSLPVRNTKALYALKSEIKLAKSLGKQFELFTGIRYTHMLSQNRGSFRSSEEFVIPNGYNIEHISLEGNSIFSKEDIHLKRITTTYNTSYQRMYLVDWQLGANYSKQFNSWAIFANVSAAYNLFSKANGNYITLESKFTEIKNEIKNQLGISLTGGLGVSYLLKNRNTLSLNMDYTKYLNSFNRSKSIQENYKLLGLQVAYKMRF